MFKSVFAKYISVFMLIILVSFGLLTAITGAIVSGYATDAKVDMIKDTAAAATEYLENDIVRTNNDKLSVYVNSRADALSDVMRAFASNSDDLTLLIVNTRGKVLLLATGNGGSANISASIPDEIFYEFSNNTEAAEMSAIEGIFDSPQTAVSVPIKSGEGDDILGSLFVCTSSLEMSDLLEVMIKTVFMSSLWIMLAAMIAVYFMTERIVNPLREMSRAAKSFAEGDFSARVPVHGHDEVAQLAEGFNNMAASLESSEKLRNTFMANVSHDLRTPMTTIAGFIDGIIDGVIPPEKHEYYLGVIATEVRRLSRLVAQLLDISRMQAGDRKFNMQPFDVCEMGRQILFSFEQKIDKKRLEVEFDCEFDNMYVNADHDAIYQILYNICDNAVKFSGEGGTLRLSVHEKAETGKIFIEVYNEGQGIPAEDLPYVFERFYKSDKSRGIDKTGVGLGLYIAKTIIEAHHERIWVDSEYGRYCKFGFTLQKVSKADPSGKDKL